MHRLILPRLVGPITTGYSTTGYNYEYGETAYEPQGEGWDSFKSMYPVSDLGMAKKLNYHEKGTKI